MPATIPVHVALRTELRKSVSEALAFNERLEVLISVKSRQSGDNNFHGKIDFSQPPWNAAIANVIMDLHAQAREAEDILRLTLKLPYRPRGGSSNNTSRAMENIIRLCDGADDSYVASNNRWINSWCNRAQIALDEEEAPRKLYRVEGKSEAPCPWCKRRTLRMKPLDGSVWCIIKDCRDDQDRRPRAQVQYSSFTRQMELVWQDNIVGMP